MKDVGFITSGDGAHLQCYLDYRAVLDDEIYLRTLDAVDLAAYRAIVIPDFSTRICCAAMHGRSATISAMAVS